MLQVAALVGTKLPPSNASQQQRQSEGRVLNEIPKTVKVTKERIAKVSWVFFHAIPNGSAQETYFIFRFVCGPHFSPQLESSVPMNMVNPDETSFSPHLCPFDSQSRPASADIERQKPAAALTSAKVPFAA